MAKLDRLKLLGIRSFGPESKDAQEIKFESPLTLIQGQNGCGKTTIIESIKFAITGELPGGTARGQGFVYDPKLSHNFETVGQIKLRIVTSNSQKYIVTKSVRVQQKSPDKLEFKRLDSAISRVDTSDPNHVSSRCADVDQEITLILGVAKPIINQVLFCHQEDSNWPLEESKKLKERFDEIFDAAKYNKCLEHIGKKIKERHENLKKMHYEVAGLFDKKTYVESRKLTLSDKQTKYDNLTDDINKYTTEIEPLNERINELYQEEQNFAKLHTNYELKKKELSILKKQYDETLANINEFTGSDDELQEKLSKFQEDLKTLAADIEALRCKKDQIENKEQHLMKMINNEQKSLGGLQSEQKQNEQRIKERNNLIKTLCSTDFSIPITNTDDDNLFQASRYINELKESVQNKKDEITNKQKSFEKEEDALQTEIDKVREENIQLKQNVESVETQRRELNEEVRSIKRKLNELNTANDQLKLAESKLQRTEREISALEGSVDTEQLRRDIETQREQVHVYKTQNVKLENEIKELQQYASIQTELDVKREEYLSKQIELNKLRNKHEDLLKSIVADDNNDSDNYTEVVIDLENRGNLKQTVEQYTRKRNSRVQQMQSLISGKQKQVLRCETNIANCEEKLQKIKDELKEAKVKIEKYCTNENKSLEEQIDETNEKINVLQNNHSTYYSSNYLYGKYIQVFEEEKPQCPVCKQHVHERTMANEIITDLRKKVELIPVELDKINRELTQEKDLYQTLLSLRPVNERVETLSNEEMPTLEEQLSKHRLDFEQYNDELKKFKSDLTTIQEETNVANAIVGDVSLMDQYRKEMTTLQRHINDLEKQLPSFTVIATSDLSSSVTGNRRGIEEAMSEREHLNIDLTVAQNNIESMQKKLEQYNDRLNKLREQKNTLILQQLNIKKNLQDKDHLVTKSVETETKIERLTVQLKNLEAELEPTQEKLTQANRRKAECKLNNKRKLNEVQRQLDLIQKKLTEILRLHDEINLYERRNVSEQINNIMEKVTELRNELDTYRTKKEQIDENLDDLKRQTTNSNVYYRELEDNKNLRIKRKQLATLSEEVRTEERKLSDSDIKKIRNEKLKLIEQQDQLHQRKLRADGQRTTLKEDIVELKHELKQPKNENAAKEYQRKKLEYLLLESTIVDIREFVKAMDWSLMQYHKRRMVQVNDLIKELWRKIYRGNDIDYIEIKTDDIRVQGQDKRKVYNYQVVQVKNEVELEMRGRCSAGQRVLASLIIRIALAETFSANCGVLALDEPTTNLDRENINSLADTLIELVQTKRQQRNFQLIVITHDQEFIDRLTQTESVEKYYEVKRDANGKSTIIARTTY